jgi:hypothetical protein
MSANPILLIKTPADRHAHIEWCREKDRQSRRGEVPNSQHYENLGDIASCNAWWVRNSLTGYQEFRADTPDWVVTIAKSRQWISEKGGMNAKQLG